MDKLLEIVMAAVVISVTGLAVLFVVNSQTSSATGFFDNQSQGAQCDLQKTQWEDAVCGSGDPSEIKSNTPDSCTEDWDEQSVSC